jgi:aminopeptidase N
MTPAERARVVALESDGFARWDALQHLALEVLLARAGVTVPGLGCVDAAEAALSQALGALLADSGAHPAFVAECLALPDFDTLADAVPVVDPAALLDARERLLQALAEAHRAALQVRFDDLRAAAAGGLHDAAMGARSLRHAALGWLSRVDGGDAARGLWGDARSMTERMAALRALVHARAEGADDACRAFAAEFADHALVTDKWLAVVASRPAADALDDVAALMAGPHWVPANPNRVRAIVGSFARLNPAGFHRVDGAGYRFVAGQVHALDAVNPQVAARLLGAFEGLPRWTASARSAALAALAPLRSGPLSRDVAELLGRLLA